MPRQCLSLRVEVTSYENTQKLPLTQADHIYAIENVHNWLNGLFQLMQCVSSDNLRQINHPSLMLESIGELGCELVSALAHQLGEIESDEEKARTANAA